MAQISLGSRPCGHRCAELSWILVVHGGHSAPDNSLLGRGPWATRGRIDGQGLISARHLPVRQQWLVLGLAQQQRTGIRPQSSIERFDQLAYLPGQGHGKVLGRVELCPVTLISEGAKLLGERCDVNKGFGRGGLGHGRLFADVYQPLLGKGGST